jgi:hypothetical protein
MLKLKVAQTSSRCFDYSSETNDDSFWHGMLAKRFRSSSNHTREDLNNDGNEQKV